MNNITISVIIPVYNAEKFLHKALQSVLIQPEVKEIILVEDGSSDDSLKVCKNLISRDQRVKLFQHPGGENRGAGATRNLAISKATQDYIAFLDADDYFLRGRFDKTKSVFKQFTNTDGVYECIGTDFLNDQAKKSYGKTKRPPLTTVTNPNILPEDLFMQLVLTKYGYFSLDGLTVRRSAIDEGLMFDETLRIAQDTDFILRLADQKILRPGNIEEPVSMRGVHGDNRTLVTSHVLKSKKQFYHKWFRQTKNNNWPKSVNRQFLIQYSLTSARIKTLGIGQWPLAIINVIRNLLSNPWIIRKII